MNIPVKPFPTYTWRWLSVTPSEGLLEAPVFLGVLRALQNHEGKPYRSLGLHQELQRIQIDTGTNVDLARTPERNLFRNSGQYWRGTGLVEPVKGEILLTGLGHHVAAGKITNSEFAALMVRNTILPNPATYKDTVIQQWRMADLRIKPLELILASMDMLGREYGIEHAFLSPNELMRVIIPLAGDQATVSVCCHAVYEYRTGKLDVTAWPDCVPNANDKRLAREFLLFLENFGICQINKSDNKENNDKKFYLDQVLSDEIRPDIQRSFIEDSEILDAEIENSRYSEIPIIIERKRVATSVLRRTNQSKFRRQILSAANNRCILTNETTLDVIEAAHIVPVGHGGSDHVGNGFCMRVDIHRLYDSGKIRINPDGSVELNEQIKNTVSYSGLPKNIQFPVSVSNKNVEWRSRYL